MKENKKFKINVKNGLYVGDLCYALDDKIYRGVWCDKYNCEDGNFVDPETGLEFAMVGTAYGDGYYESNMDFEFPVDAGIIGIADLDICTKDYRGLGLTFPEVKGIIEINYIDGIIIIAGAGQYIKIDTIN